MEQQQTNFKERVEQWAIANGFKLNLIGDVSVHFKRISDGYPIEVNVRLLDNIMNDEGY